MQYCSRRCWTAPADAALLPQMQYCSRRCSTAPADAALLPQMQHCSRRCSTAPADAALLPQMQHCSCRCCAAPASPRLQTYLHQNWLRRQMGRQNSASWGCLSRRAGATGGGREGRLRESRIFRARQAGLHRLERFDDFHLRLIGDGGAGSTLRAGACLFYYWKFLNW